MSITSINHVRVDHKDWDQRIHVFALPSDPFLCRWSITAIMLRYWRGGIRQAIITPPGNSLRCSSTLYLASSLRWVDYTFVSKCTCRCTVNNIIHRVEWSNIMRTLISRRGGQLNKSNLLSYWNISFYAISLKRAKRAWIDSIPETCHAVPDKITNILLF
jgi:hypothetical protein